MIKPQYKYLAKNVSVLTISNFGSKLLSFVLIPLYTSILTTEEYGTYDLYTTIVSLAIPILTLNICAAILRFSLDKEVRIDKIVYVGGKFCFRACLIFYVLVLANYYFSFFGIFAEYPFFLCLYMTLCVFYEFCSQLSRGMEKIADVAAAGVLNSVVMLVLNILFLKVFEWGLQGYFLANCLAFAVPLLYLTIRLHIWKYIEFKTKDKELQQEMSAYSKPLVFDSISWWIINVSDRYVVTLICGVAANGVYSVASKIPSVLNIVQTIFNQAWSISAVKEFDPKNAKFYKNIYGIYNLGMIFLCSVLIITDKLLARILFAKEFYEAWVYAPWLMISVVFGSLAGVLSGILNADKSTKITAQTTVIGAVINTILNFVLVYVIGPSGAAVATMIAYATVWGKRYYHVNKIIDMNVNLYRDLLAYVVLIIQAVITVFIQGGYAYACNIFLMVFLVVMYRRQILYLLTTIKDIMKNLKPQI